MGKQEDTIFPELQRTWGQSEPGGAAHQSLLFYFVINVKDEEVAVS